MDILFLACGPSGAPTCSVLGGEGGAVGCRGDGRAPGVLTGCTNCTTAHVRGARARDRQRRDHRKHNFHLLGGAVGAGGEIRLGRGAEGRSLGAAGSCDRVVICLVQVVRRARRPLERCGGQVARRRGARAVQRRRLPMWLRAAYPVASGIIPAASRACFPFLVAETFGAGR